MLDRLSITFRLTVLLAWLLAVTANTAGAQQNPSFEEITDDGESAPAHWILRGGDFVLDSAFAADGTRSLRLTNDGRRGSARVTQRMDPPRVAGNRLRISAWVKTEGVRDGSVGLWLRVDSEQGLLYVDGMRDAGASGTTDWARYELEAPIFPAAATIELGAILRGTGTAWIDAVEIEGLDTRGRPAPAAAAARYLDRALDIMQQHSIRRESIDWTHFRASVVDQARGATSAADAYPAVRFALGSLGDHHSYLMTPDRAVALEAAPVANARTGRVAVPPRGETLEDEMAYVWIPGFAGGSPAKQVEFAERLQETIRQLDRPQTCGWIVDLRGNTGGNVWPMLAGIGPLLGNGEAAAAVYPDGRRVPLWYRDGKAGLGDYVQLRVTGEAYRTRSPEPPVAVLFGPRTASSGEIVAAAFRGIARHRSFGSPTRGLSTGNRTFPLADGAALVLTVAATSDRNGTIYVGPMKPDESTPEADEDAVLLEQEAVRAALVWLEQQCAGDDPS